MAVLTTIPITIRTTLTAHTIHTAHHLHHLRTLTTAESVKIYARNFAAAYSELNSVAHGDRGAEWHFLMGCTLMGMGRIFDARAHLERACQMDPSNAEYRAARDQAANVTFSSQGWNGQPVQGARGCSACDVCTSLICADCLCECCGGDLISCC